MQRRTRASKLVAAVAVALVVTAAGCNRKPAESTVGSTDTMQPAPQTTGTTATETGGGPPVTTSSATGTGTTAGTAGATGTH